MDFISILSIFVMACFVGLLRRLVSHPRVANPGDYREFCRTSRKCYSLIMPHNQAFDVLKSLEPRLRTQGVWGLQVFGSQTRVTATATSDIDLMFDIAPDARFSLFDQARITRELSELLKIKVDFVPRRSLHPLVKAKAETEWVTIFN